MAQIDHLLNSPFNVSAFSEVLDEMNSLFDPPLAERILKRSNVSSMKDYINKVLKHGNIVIQYNQQEIEGTILFYANDLKDFRAYIPVLGIRTKYHRTGVGNDLLKRAIEIIKSRGMHTISVKTWKKNEAAIALYKKKGFKIIKSDHFEVVMELEIKAFQ